MSDTKRRSKGAAMMQKVYGSVVPVPPEGTSAFADLMLEQLFAEVWTREALENGEITPQLAREMLIHLAQYAGYPRVSALLRVTEEAIAAATTRG